MLNEAGTECLSADDIAREHGCMEGDVVDIDCLRNSSIPENTILESHYSHSLRCSHIIILEAPEELVIQRLRERGYTEDKISGNIDTQLSGIIYSESLDNLPSTKITRIDCNVKDINAVYNEVRSEIKKIMETKS